METICRFEGCQKPKYKGSQGYCSAHYQRLGRAGLLERKRAKHGERTIKICSVDGCGMDAEKGGNKMCPIHYQRMKKNGTLQLTNPPPSDELKASIIDDYLSGESASQIGRCCGISGQKVCYWLIKWGISKRPHKFQLGHKLNTIKSRKTDGFGYILIYKPEHPNASRGFVREHRLVMEDVLGRLLTRDEVVHHINNDPSDNRPENLEVASQSTHARDHRIALGHLTNESGRYTVITLACQCCGKSYKRKIIKLCRPCRAPPISV